MIISGLINFFKVFIVSTIERLTLLSTGLSDTTSDSEVESRKIILIMYEKYPPLLIPAESAGICFWSSIFSIELTSYSTRVSPILFFMVVLVNSISPIVFICLRADLNIKCRYREMPSIGGNKTKNNKANLK